VAPLHREEAPRAAELDRLDVKARAGGDSSPTLLKKRMQAQTAWVLRLLHTDRGGDKHLRFPASLYCQGQSLKHRARTNEGAAPGMYGLSYIGVCTKWGRPCAPWG
jgi:hypothetical protein